MSEIPITVVTLCFLYPALFVLFFSLFSLHHAIKTHIYTDTTGTVRTSKISSTTTTTAAINSTATSTTFNFDCSDTNETTRSSNILSQIPTSVSNLQQLAQWYCQPGSPKPKVWPVRKMPESMLGILCSHRDAFIHLNLFKPSKCPPAPRAVRLQVSSHMDAFNVEHKDLLAYLAKHLPQAMAFACVVTAQEGMNTSQLLAPWCFHMLSWPVWIPEDLLLLRGLWLWQYPKGNGKKWLHHMLQQTRDDGKLDNSSMETAFNDIPAADGVPRGHAQKVFAACDLISMNLPYGVNIPKILAVLRLLYPEIFKKMMELCTKSIAFVDALMTSTIRIYVWGGDSRRAIDSQHISLPSPAVGYANHACVFRHLLHIPGPVNLMRNQPVFNNIMRDLGKNRSTYIKSFLVCLGPTLLKIWNWRGQSHQLSFLSSTADFFTDIEDFLEGIRTAFTGSLQQLGVPGFPGHILQRVRQSTWCPSDIDYRCHSHFAFFCLFHFAFFCHCLPC